MENQFQEFSLAGLPEFSPYPENLAGWDEEVIRGFGSKIDELGYIGSPRYYVTVDKDDDLGDGNVRTPMLELRDTDYLYTQVYGRPYDGMIALGDTGALYRYDGLSGLFAKIKKGLKKLGRKLKKGAKKLLSKTKFGRALIKVGGKVRDVAMKVVKPLIKKFGPIMQKIAPMAAMIPGVGPAVSVVMAKAGKAAEIMKKYGGKIKEGIAIAQNSGAVERIFNVVAKDPAGLKKALAAEAARIQKALPKQKIEAIAASMKNVPASAIRSEAPSKASIEAARKLSRAARVEAARDNSTRAAAAAKDPAKRQAINAHIAALAKYGIMVPLK